MAEYRGHKITSQKRKGGDGYIASASGPTGKYGPFGRATKEEAVDAIKDAIKANTWRDLDDEPLTDDEQEERTLPSVPPRPKKQGLSHFLDAD